jgi:hypothetical protein
MCTLIFTIRKLNNRKSAAKLGSVIRKALQVAEQQLKGTFVAELLLRLVKRLHFVSEQPHVIG